MALSKRIQLRYDINHRAAKRGLSELESGTEKVRKKTNQAAGAMSRLGNGLRSGAKGAAGFLASADRLGDGLSNTATAIRSVADGFVMVAEKAAFSQVALDNLPFSINRARGATRGLVDDLTLQQQALAASQFGVAKTEEEFGRLAKAATTLGLAAGRDATTSIQDLTNALARGEKEVLDNLNIILTQEEANRKYAAQIGKVASELTEAERKQAFMTIGLQKAEEAAGKLNVRLDQSAQFILELRTQATNFATEFSRDFVGALSNASNALEDTIGDITGLNDELAELNAANGGRFFSFFNPNFAQNVEKAKELERTRKAQLADAQEMAEIEAEVAAFEREGFELELRSLKLQIAGTTNQKELNRLLSKEANLKATLLELDGRNAEAEQLVFDDFLRQRRFRAQRRKSNDRFARERKEFQRELTKAINAERLREFSEATSLQRNFLADTQRFQDELAAARAPSLDRFDGARQEQERLAELEQAQIQRSIELSRIRGSSLETYNLEQQAFTMREEALRRQLELESEVGQREAIEDELAQVRHERTISRLTEEQRKREETQQAIVTAINSVNAAQRGAFQLSTTIASATIEGETRKKRVLDGIKAAGLFADAGVAAAQSGIAFASGNIPQGIALAAAAANATAQGIQIAAGNAGPGSGSAGGTGTAAGAALGRGQQPERAIFQVDRGAPISVREDIEGNPNNTGGGRGTNAAARVVNIERIDVLGAIDDDSANKIRTGLKRVEANLGA